MPLHPEQLRFMLEMLIHAVAELLRQLRVLVEENAPAQKFFDNEPRKRTRGSDQDERCVFLSTETGHPPERVVSHPEGHRPSDEGIAGEGPGPSGGGAEFKGAEAPSGCATQPCDLAITVFSPTLHTALLALRGTALVSPQAPVIAPPAQAETCSSTLPPPLAKPPLRTWPAGATLPRMRRSQ